MTPEQEVDRIKQDYKEHWAKIEMWPSVQQAIAENDQIKLGEVVAMIVHGNIGNRATENDDDYKWYLAFQERERLIAEKMRRLSD